MLSVRGIGVAVSVSTWTSARSSLRRSLSLTPKRCSSSMMTSPRRRNVHASLQQPVRTDDDVDLSRFETGDDLVDLFRAAKAR